MSEICESLLNGRWQWILNVKRYQNRHTIDPLSVADHSWLTAMLGLMIYDSIDFNMDTEWTHMERGEVVIKALLHDIEEGMTGDIPLEKETRDAMKYAKGLVTTSIIKMIFPSKLKDGYLYEHKNAKTDSVSGSIIRYADMLSALIEALREKQLGNTNFDDVVNNAMNHLNEMFLGIECGNDTLRRQTINYLNSLTDEIIAHISLTYGIRARNMV